MKNCAVCNIVFTPQRMGQRVCSPRCAHKKVKADKKAEKQQDKERKEKLKTRRDIEAECQQVFNKYVRLRDAGDGCISCNKPASWHGQWHASHYRSVGAAPHLRFHLWNVHKACSVCNNHLSGNRVEYTPRLKQKIGDEKFEWLSNANYVSKRSAEYLARLKAVMTKKVKRLEKRHGMHS